MLSRDGKLGMASNESVKASDCNGKSHGPEEIIRVLILLICWHIELLSER